MKPKKEVNLLLWIGIVLAAVVVVALVFLFAGPKDQPESTPETTEAAATEATTVPTEPVKPEVLFFQVGRLNADEITDSKALTWIYKIEGGTELSRNIDLEFLPQESVPAAPEAVRYIVNIKYCASRATNYIGLLQVYYTSIKAEVIDVITGEKIAAEEFPGAELPEEISSTESKYYAPYPDEALVQNWAQTTLNEIRTQKQQEVLDTVEELAAAYALSYADILEDLYSYGTFSAADVAYASDYYSTVTNDTPETEKAAATGDTSANQNEAALTRAKQLLDSDTGYSPTTLAATLVDYYAFTKDEAAYAVENCGADWDAEALKVAISFLEYKMGYSHSGMLLVLVHDYGFTQAQAEYAANNCNADWNQVAVDHVELFMEYAEKPYTRSRMIDEMVEYYGFTMEQAIYAVDKVGLK